MLDQTSARIDDAALNAFREGFRGQVILPGDDAFDAARRVWNGTIDKTPAIVVRPTGVADVIASTNFARDNDLLLSVRCGGHSTPGHSTCDGGLVIDLSAMRGVTVDPAARVARVAGGALLGDLDHETLAFGLATTTGTVAHTGVGGLTLGGGMGRLQRKHGLSIDNLLSVDIVTADGRLVHASEDENADLFWGIRGAGPNFGVVTSFEFKLHPLGPLINAAISVYERDAAQDVLADVRDFCANAPDEVITLVAFTTISPMPPFPPELHGKAALLVGANHCGTPEQAEKDLAPLKAIGSPAFQIALPLPYSMMQRMQDDVYAWGKRYYVKGMLISDLPKDAVDALGERAAKAPGAHDEIVLFQMGGAVGRVAEDATAFSGRDAAFFVGAESAWEDPAEDAAHQDWSRETFAAIAPFAASGNYANALSGEEPDGARLAYGDAKYGRLVELKNTFDPTNLFRLNTNIKPSV